MPVWNILVSDTRGYVEHNDSALAINVVSITKPTKLFLTGGVPYVENYLAEVLSISSVIFFKGVPNSER